MRTRGLTRGTGPTVNHGGGDGQLLSVSELAVRYGGVSDRKSTRLNSSHRR